MAVSTALTPTIATRYQRLDKAGKTQFLDELCAVTGWHRDHARKALRIALQPPAARRRVPRPPKYGPNAIAALVFCWSVLGMPAGKRLAPIMGELVAALRRFDELHVDDDTAELLQGMSAATIDRRLAPERKKLEFTGLTRTMPGTLLNPQIPIRIWADWDSPVPGFVAVDLVGHKGDNAAGGKLFTLIVTDAVTGWTEKRSVPRKSPEWVLPALADIAKVMPFPILGVDPDASCHVAREYWPAAPAGTGYHRFETTPELALLNRIWSLQSQLSNYFCPQQKLITKSRCGAKVSKKYDTATTPHRRAARHAAVSDEDKAILADTYASINPAALQRQIQALTATLLAITGGGVGADGTQAS